MKEKNRFEMFGNISQMDSNTCEYRYMRGEHKGKKCPNPRVFEEKVCRICIFRSSSELVSEKFLDYINDLELAPMNDGHFFSMKYGFMLEYDGKMHLKGMGEEKEEKQYIRREATEEEKKLAKSLGIKINDGRMTRIEYLEKMNRERMAKEREEIKMSSAEYLGKILDIQIKIITDVKKEQQKLIQIVLEKTDAKSRLRSIRQLLLELKLDNKEEKTSTPNAILAYSSLVSGIPNLSIDQMEDLTNTMNKTFEPMVKHRKLMDKIAEIIRSSDVTDEEKIDRIADLLI